MPVRCLFEHSVLFAPISLITPEMLLPSTADTFSIMTGNSIHKVNRRIKKNNKAFFFSVYGIFFSLHPFCQSSSVVSDGPYKNLPTVQETGTVTLHHHTTRTGCGTQAKRRKIKLQGRVVVCVCRSAPGTLSANCSSTLVQRRSARLTRKAYRCQPTIV